MRIEKDIPEGHKKPEYCSSVQQQGYDIVAVSEFFQPPESAFG